MKDRLARETRQYQDQYLARSGLPDNDIDAVENIIDGSLGKYHRPFGPLSS